LDKDEASSQQIVVAARSLRPFIEACADEIDRQAALPSRLVSALVNAGLFRMTLPRSIGGLETPLPVYAEAVEEIAQADASTGWCMAQNAGVAVAAGAMTHEGALEVFGAPDLRSAGGYGPAKAVRVPGGYRLTGEWRYCSGIRHATWLRANTSIVSDASASPLADPSVDETGANRGMLFFPASDAEIVRVWDVSGLRGTGSDTCRVSDLFVPEQRSVVRPAPEQGPLYVLGTNQVFMAGFGSVALGLARSTLDALIDLAAGKTARGMSNHLREHHMVQSRVAIAEATLESARAYFRNTIENLWQDVKATHAVSLEHRVRLRLATTFTMHQCASVVDTAYHTAGGDAIFAKNGFERRFRDMHAVTQQVQARQDHYESAGQWFLGLEPDRSFL